MKEWCRAHEPVLYPCKGHDHLLTPIQHRMIEGVEVRNVDVNSVKDHLFNLMNRPTDHTGRWTVHRDIDDVYRRHMSSEHKVAVLRTGTKRASKRRRVWQKKHGVGSPHFRDAEVYALAAAKDLGLHEELLDESTSWRNRQRARRNPASQITTDFQERISARMRGQRDAQERWLEGAEEFFDG